MSRIAPVANIVSLLMLLLGGMMLIPGIVDAALGNGNAQGFIEAAIITCGVGGFVFISTRGTGLGGFDHRMAFLLTFAIWVVLPVFAALPFMIGAPGLGVTDAYFEAVSGITTTGSTVIVGTEDYPAGMNLWRGMMNWTGGLGIAFLAMIFLPIMRVGGMQFFRAEGFDTFGKILPRASDIAISLFWVYAGLTVLCVLTYSAVGMTPLDAVVHAFATIATGGFSTESASFGKYPGAGEYAGSVFMILSGVPYIRYVQLVRGSARPLWQEPQVRAYLRWIAIAVVTVVLWRMVVSDDALEPVFREASFNLISIFTGTGFGSGSFSGWGGFALIVALFVGFIGGCSGSSSAALSVFRVQLAGAAILSQLRRVTSPNRVVPVRYAGRTVDQETINGLMLFVTSYILLVGVLSVGLTLTGVDTESAIFAVWASIGNIGYGLGPTIAKTGTFVDFPVAAKWLLIAAMMLGRLSLLTVLLLLLPQFWRP